MKIKNDVVGNILLWGGLGTLAYLFFNEGLKSQENSTKDGIVKGNSKYNPLKNLKENGGNPLATNIKGSGKFNYLGIEQAFHKFGIECKAGSMINIYKSLGIIPPDMSREEFEALYTELYRESDAPNSKKFMYIPEKISGFKIPKQYNDALRGKEELALGQMQINLPEYVSFANSISQVSAYAKITGMENVEFKFTETKSYLDILNHLKSGWVARAFVKYAPVGHYVVANSIVYDKKNIYLLTDDTLNGAQTKYDSNSILKAWLISV